MNCKGKVDWKRAEIKQQVLLMDHNFTDFKACGYLTKYTLSNNAQTLKGKQKE